MRINKDLVSRKAVLNTLSSMDKALDTDRTVETYKELLEECFKVLPTVDAIPIPNNATNGDMIKAMFPKEARGYREYLFDGCINIDLDNIADFDAFWWNAPYRKEQNND